jgi:hypothetical protein
MNMRHAEWGHWRITFWQRDPSKMTHAHDTYHPGKMIAQINFPVGVCGPVDLPKREEYRLAVKNWVESGIAPL